MPPTANAARAELAAWTIERIARVGRGIDLTDAALASDDLSELDLRSAVFNRATLHSARLDGTDLPAPA